MKSLSSTIKPDKLTQELNKFLEEQMKTDQFSGAVLLTEKGNPIFEKVSGFSNREKGIKNELGTIFNIGSMDKMFTGVAIVQLAQAGKLDFQDVIGKYISVFPKEVSGKMTIHQILTHMEGFSSYFNNKYLNNRLHLYSVNDYLDLFKDEPLLFEPGERYQYSNSGYVVLGAIIEAVTGQSYYNYVKEHIFRIAGMSNTGSFSPDPDSPKMAMGYTLRLPHSKERAKTGESRLNIDDLPLVGSPAGGGYSTVEDLTNFAQALLENKLLNPEMTKLVLTPKVTVGEKNGQTLYYGYGFQILDIGDGNLRYGHAGSFAGVNGRLDIYPGKGLTVAVLSNYDEPSAFRVANFITSALSPK